MQTSKFWVSQGRGGGGLSTLYPHPTSHWTYLFTIMDIVYVDILTGENCQFWLFFLEQIRYIIFGCSNIKRTTIINELNEYYLHLCIQSNIIDMVILYENFIFLIWYLYWSVRSFSRSGVDGIQDANGGYHFRKLRV